MPAFLGQRGKSAHRYLGSPEQTHSYGTAEGSVDVSAGLLARKIKKEGRLSIRVESVEETVGKIEALAGRLDGAVYGLNVSNYEDVRTGSLTLKVPFESFDAAMAGIKALSAEVFNETAIAEDVTEQYIDLNVRLNNKKAEERSLSKLMEKAVKVEDILKVSKELTRAREEVETLQGKLNFLESLTSMSVIKVNLSEAAPPAKETLWKPVAEAKNAFRLLVAAFKWSVTAVIYIVISVLPLVIVYGAVLAVIFMLLRRVYQKIRKPRG